MTKNRLLLIIEVMGAITLTLTAVWFWTGRTKEGSKLEVLSQAGISFRDAVGQKAPDFTLDDTEGNEVSLGSLSSRDVVLFFTEGFMCNPCFTQLVALSADERLNNNETVSFSVVIGDQEKLHKILSNLPPLLPLKVLFDTDGNVSRLYDTVNLTSPMHKGLDNGHTYFVIDRQGVIRFAFDDPYMGVRNYLLATEIEKLKTR